MKWMRGVVGIVFLALVGWGASLAPAEAEGYRITGPFTHGALAVFLLHGAQSDSRIFITLDEGLRGGDVTVSERGGGEVNRLELENRSDQPLFLQEGDRLKGGKQDRIIGKAQVIPPHSGCVDVESFCVEPHRWQACESGTKFGININSALALNSVRVASREGSQSRVWEEVAAAKRTAGLTKTSSLTEMMDNPSIEASASAAVDALKDAIAGEDVVGVAFAINGDVREVGVYPSRTLLAKIYPRLLLSYAIEATQMDGSGRSATTADVAKFMRRDDGGSPRPASESGSALEIGFYGNDSNENGTYAGSPGSCGDDVDASGYCVVRMANGQARRIGISGIMDTGTYALNGDAYTLREPPLEWARNPSFAQETDGNPAAGNGINRTLNRESARSLHSETTYDGALVHRQWLRRR